MNKYIALGDGFPADNDFLMFIQSLIGEVATLSNIAGDDCILTGCVDTAGIVSTGYMILGGEIVKFNGGGVGANVHIIESIEQATYLEDIAPADGQGDNKDTYFTRVASFGNTGESVTAWETLKRIIPLIEVQQAMTPLGAIVMWAGSINSIPNGWALCDGSGGTPNLKGKFIVGFDTNDTDYDAIGKQAGLKRVALTANQNGQHTHLGSTNNTGSHTHSTTGYSRNSKSVRNGGGSIVADNNGNSPNTGSAGNHSHSITMNTSGQSEAHENRPPCYTLAYIQFKGL